MRRRLEKLNESHREMLRYPVAGLAGFVVDYLLYLLLLGLGGLDWYLLWKGIAFLAGLAVNYLICVRFVFRNRPKQTLSQMLLFLLAGAGALLLNWLLLHLAVEWLGISVAWANLPVSMLVFVYNFYSKRVALTLLEIRHKKYQ